LRILVTRPDDEAQRTAAALRALGHEPVIASVLHIVARPDADLGAGPWDGVLMTSGNAARAIVRHPRGEELKGLPLFAVGPQTAAAARAGGFSDVTASEGDSTALMRLVCDRRKNPASRLLYLAGNDVARDLAGELRACGLSVTAVVVYHAIAATSLPEQVGPALRNGTIDGAIHYSRRSAAIFVDCATADGLLPQIRNLRHFCLSARSSEPLREIGAPDIRVAAKPASSALMDLLRQP
jgi:uroporphyrinogen-III synthase